MASGESQDTKRPAPQRLASLRGPRDLMLLGPTTSRKKTFAPVLPSQIRPKVKQEIVSEFAPPTEVKHKPGALRHNDQAKPSHGDMDRGAGRGRGRKDIPVDESKFVQMKSAFTDGPMMMQNSRLHSAPGYGHGKDTGEHTRRSGGGGGTSGFAKSHGVEKEDTLMDLESDTKAVLDELLRDDFVQDKFSTSSEPDMAPVLLPLSRLSTPGATSTSLLPSTDYKQIRKVKQESSEVDMESKNEVQMSPVLHASDLFTSDSVHKDELLLFQLPDALPGVPFSKDSGPTTSKGAAANNQRFTLGDFEESAIGKLVVRRSGRTQLILGNVVYDVALGSQASFLQDLVSLHTEDANPSSLTVLGHVRHKLLCIPDLHQLLGTLNCSS